MISSSNLPLRVSIEYFDGINSAVSSSLVKKNELAYSINARSDSIGSISKRAGTHILGNSITATANYGIWYFSNSANNGFYRVSTVSGITTVYYLNNSAVWTALTGSGTTLFNLGDSTTQFDITNPSGTTFRYTYDTTGTDPDIDAHLRIGSEVVIAAQNFTAVNNGTFTVTGVSANYFDITNDSGLAENNKTIGTGSIKITANNFSSTIADGQLFLVNGHHDNIYISGTDGTTVTSSTSVTGHLYNSPKAHKVNFYKDKIYLADYITGATRYKNGVFSSSKPLGILSLVDGDHAATDCEADDWISVTDTKYIYNTDTIDIYRGNSKVADITIKDKDEHRFQINAITFAGSYTTLNSSDEIWVNDTQAGTVSKKFRWAGNPASGINVKQYDVFTISGQNDAITILTNIGDVMLIANKHNISIWNNSSLQIFNIGIGCVSERGYVKNNGVLFFLGYDGVYSTSGGIPNLESAKVQEFFDGSTKSGKEAGAMGLKGNSIFVSLGDVTLYWPDGSVRETLVDVVLEKNLQQSNWFCHVGISATMFANYITSDNTDRLEFADDGTNCNIYEFLYSGSVTDDETSTAKEILFRADSNNLPLAKNFEKVVNPLEVVVESERGHNIQVFVSLDNANFYPLSGNAIKGCSIFKITNRDVNESAPVRCRNIAISIRDYSKSPCRITRVALIYNPTNEEEQFSQTNYGK